MNPKDEAVRSEGRVPLELIPPVAEILMARALEDGANKYGPWDFRGRPVKLSTYIGAMKRHINALQSGEVLDPKSGQHHLAHVMAGCAIVLDAATYGNLEDDLPK